MDEIKLRGSLFGFNRRDVYNYISELSERNASKLAAKESETGVLRSELFALKQEHEKLKTESTIEIEKINVLLSSKIKESDFYSERLRAAEEEKGSVVTTKSYEVEQLRNELQRSRNEFNDLKSNAQSQAERLRSALDVKTREVEQYTEKIARLERDMGNTVYGKNEEMTLLKGELEKVSGEFAAFRMESSVQIEKLKSELVEKDRQNEYNALRLKAMEDDRESILAAMVSAEGEARRIVEHAKAKADGILEQLNGQISDKRREMESLTQDIKMLRSQMASISQKFSSQIDDTMREHVIDVNDYRK